MAGAGVCQAADTVILLLDTSDVTQCNTWVLNWEFARQALARVTPLRDFFLLPANYAACRSPLVQRFGELLRKAWNTRNFKGQAWP